jgi:peroxidase
VPGLLLLRRQRRRRRSGARGANGAPHPHTLDTLYYWGVLRNRGLFASDQALLASAPTAAQARQSAYGGYLWNLKLAAAMVKMGQIQVLTGSGGQVKAKCSTVN